MNIDHILGVWLLLFQACFVLSYFIDSKTILLFDFVNTISAFS